MEGGNPSTSSTDDFESLPVSDRLSHKLWKARLSAYTSIIDQASKTIDEDDSFFNQHFVNNPSSIREWVRDPNAVAQDKGVEAACKVVEMGGKSMARSRSEVVPSVVEKCLGSARATTRTKGIELCMLYVEVEEDMGEGVISDVVPGLEVKQPKVVAGCVTVLRELIYSFGPKSISLKPLLATLPKIFGHADKTVRSEGSLLCLSLHSYLGPALTPHLSELKPVQQKELQETFDKADQGGIEGYGFGKLKPKRFTWSVKRDMKVREAQGALEGTVEGGGNDGEEGGEEEIEDEPEAPIDPYDLANPISIVTSLPPDFYTNLSSSKWKDRKELALEPLLQLLNSSLRYNPSENYTELVSALAGRMTDANVLCVMLSAQCIERLAKGLREGFDRGLKGIVTVPMLQRTKEKKQNVLDALGNALDAVYASTTIGEFTEDATTFTKDKNPSVKLQTLLFYTRCLRSTTSPPPKPDLPTLIESFKKTLEDSDAAVRSAAADVLGTLMRVIGERAFGAMVGEVDPMRMEKVKEAFEDSETKCKDGRGPGSKAVPAKAPPPAAAVAKPRPKPAAAASKPKPPPTSSFDTDELDQPPPAPKPVARGPPARLLGAKKPSPSSSTSAPPPSTSAPAKKAPPSTSRAAPAPSAAGGGGSNKPSEPLRFKFSQETAESQVENQEAIPSNLITMLNDSAWKVRLEAMDKLSEWCKLDGRSVEAEIIVRWLVGRKPGPKESNFQVAGKMFALFQQLAEDSSSWSKACIAVAIPACCDKMGDIKLKKPAGDALGVFAEKSSLGFVLSQAYEPMSKQKAPKTLQESFAFVDQALQDFGIVGGLAVRDLIEFLKVGLKHSNAAVRTQATKTLVTLRLFVGPNITSFLSDLTPQLLSTIDSDFEKVANDAAPTPTRVGADTVVAAAPAAPGGGGGKSKGGSSAPEVDPMDELFPRVDFDRLVSGSTISACGDANWKVRKEGLEAIRDTLEANKRLKPSGLPDLVNPLKARITDSNKIIQMLALDIVARIATGMGKPFGDRLSKQFAPSVAQVLADQKANIRAAGITTLSAIADASGLEHLVGSFDKPLEANNPVQRKELLAWLEERFKDSDALVDLDLAGLAGPVLACLEDRNSDVRKSATALLPSIISKTGFAFVMDLVSKLKPASRSTVLPIVESARSSAAAVAPSAPPPSAPASRAASSASTASRPPAARPPPPASPIQAAPPAAAPPPSRAPGGLRPTSKPLRTAAPSTSAYDEPSAPSAVPPRLAQPRARASISGLRSAATSRPASSAASSSSPSSDREAPFRSSDPNPKVLRHRKETGSMKWIIEGTPRSDQIEWLSSQMASQVSATLHGQLFSTDHSAERDFHAALSTMDDCAKEPMMAEQYDLDGDEMRDRIVANLDLIIKYITLRIGMTSTTITMKCLDLIEHFMPLLVSAGYKMSDYEASPLLTCLISKVGDSKEVIRQRVRGIFKSICSVYPFSKVFTTILELGLDNKNTRVRSECVEELGQLYARHGVSIYPPSQALPKIASFIGKPDATTRTAALHAIGAVYTLVGPDATWKAVGTLPAKDRSMLEERLKRTTTGASSPAPPTRSTAPVERERPGTPSGGLRPPSNRPTAPSSPAPPPSSGLGLRGALPRPGGIPSRLQRPQSIAAPSDTNGHTTRKSLSGIPSSSRIAPPVSRIASGASSIASGSTAFTEDDLMAETVTDLPSLIDALDTDDFSACADVLKLITREISKNSELVLLQADSLIDAITAKMELGFTDLSADTPPAQLRLCKHLMQTLSAFFDKRTLSQQVSRMPLTGLLADLTGRLLDTADNPASEPIQSLSKVLNMVLIRIFHHSDQNVCFGALLTVLQDATVDLRELRGEELADRAKYAELVMKCLWKVSKTVKESLESQQLLAPRLLSDINTFLVTIPPAEWRRRSTDNVPLADMPLRTVKTILQQVVSVLKNQVFDELDEIESAENSFVYQYLYRLANQPTTGNGGESAIRSQMIGRKPSNSSIGSGRSLPSRNSTMSPPLGAPTARSVSSASNGSNGTATSQVASPGGSDIAVNQRLKEIFDLIGDPNNSRSGISALYEFQKEHPEASARIATWMAGTGSYFQTYLKRALSNLEATDRERKTEAPTSPTSESMSGVPSRLSRPSSVASLAPGTPTRSSRLSVGPSTSGTPQTSAKLAELKSMFGVADRE